jgi:four helix bundle protein
MLSLSASFYHRTSVILFNSRIEQRGLFESIEFSWWRHALCSEGRMPHWLPSYEDGQDIRDRSFEFACRVVEFCKRLYDAGGVARLMTAQLLSASTSIPSMLEEARAAESKRDFVSKCCIGLKEARESHVRLRLCRRCSLGPSDEAANLVDEANQIVSIVTTIVRNTRRNAGLKKTGKNGRKGARIPNS